jgi:hypothetical protein
MARPKKTAEPKTDENGDVIEAPKRVIIRAKTPMDWAGLLKGAHDAHWRVLRIQIQIREWILAGKPSNLKAADAMLKARGLEEFVAEAADIVDPTERAAEAASVAKSEGLCEFHRRTDRPGIWLPANNIKAMLKENWSVLGKRVQVRGSRGALAEGIFVCGDGGTSDARESDWVSLGDAPDGIYVSTSHTTGPSGPVASIKRNEYRIKPILTFELMMANATSVSDKISDDELVDTLIHAGEHGLGASRSQGFGKFDILHVDGMPAISEIQVGDYARRAAEIMGPRYSGGKTIEAA